MFWGNIGCILRPNREAATRKANKTSSHGLLYEVFRFLTECTFLRPLRGVAKISNVGIGIPYFHAVLWRANKTIPREWQTQHFVYMFSALL